MKRTDKKPDTKPFKPFKPNQKQTDRPKPGEKPKPKPDDSLMFTLTKSSIDTLAKYVNLNPTQ
jgi:hypothetical protein